MIIQTVNFYDFIRAFETCDRGEQFSREALSALFDYYDELSDDTGEPYSLDVIAICCEWSELDDDDIFNDYGERAAEELEMKEDDVTTDDIIDYLRGLTYIIELENSTLVQKI